MRKLLTVLLFLFLAPAAFAQDFKGSRLPTPSPTPVEVASGNEAFTKALVRSALRNPAYAQISSPYARRFYGSTLPATCTTYQTQVDSSTGKLNILGITQLTKFAIKTAYESTKV